MLLQARLIPWELLSIKKIVFCVCLSNEYIKPRKLRLFSADSLGVTHLEPNRKAYLLFLILFGYRTSRKSLCEYEIHKAVFPHIQLIFTCIFRIQAKQIFQSSELLYSREEPAKS